MKQKYTRGTTLHCPPASPADGQSEASLCPIFLDFVRRFCFNLDFRSYSQTEPSYSRLRVPVSRIPSSLVSALVLRDQTHKHWVKPTSNRIKDRNHLLALGTIDVDDEFNGVMHLRIELNDQAFIWVATQTALNSTEAIEASMWLRAVSGLTLINRQMKGLADIVYAPAPITSAHKDRQVRCELVQGPLLKVPDFATHTEVLLKTHGTGWHFEELTPAQQDLLGPLVRPGSHRQHPKEFFNQALLQCVAAMARGKGEDESARIAADSLCTNLTYFSRKPDHAIQMGQRFVKAIQTRTPLVEDSYRRRDDELTASKQQAMTTAHEVKTLSDEQRLAAFNDFLNSLQDQ